jgi:hypothetical protein
MASLLRSPEHEWDFLATDHWFFLHRNPGYSVRMYCLVRYQDSQPERDFGREVCTRLLESYRPKLLVTGIKLEVPIWSYTIYSSSQPSLIQHHTNKFLLWVGFCSFLALSSARFLNGVFLPLQKDVWPFAENTSNDFDGYRRYYWYPRRRNPRSIFSGCIWCVVSPSTLYIYWILPCIVYTLCMLRRCKLWESLLIVFCL